MEIVVLAENETYETAFLIYDGELVDLVVPDDVIGFLEGCAFGCGNEFIYRGHELSYLGIEGHSADTVVTCRNEA